MVDLAPGAITNVAEFSIEEDVAWLIDHVERLSHQDERFVTSAAEANACERDRERTEKTIRALAIAAGIPVPSKKEN